MSRHVLDELFDDMVHHQFRAWGISSENSLGAHASGVLVGRKAWPACKGAPSFSSFPGAAERHDNSIDKVGVSFGQSGWLDERLLSALHGSGKTFHTRDQGYYKRRYCHASYCLVCYEVLAAETAIYVRRLLRHPLFDAHAKRMGKVIKVTPRHIEFWEVREGRKKKVEWYR